MPTPSLFPPPSRRRPVPYPPDRRFHTPGARGPEVIAVVGNVRAGSLESAEDPQMYYSSDAAPPGVVSAPAASVDSEA